MRPRTIAALAAALALAALAAAAQKISVKDLPPHDRSWLEEEVVDIISPKEREVFLQLSSDRERGMFVEAFWKARDPDPQTPRNEFKDEHDRRIRHADSSFGRGRASGGRRSDMGRTYIVLGEPRQIERYEGLAGVYPLVVWFYSGLDNPGLPGSFHVVFFKRVEAGDYVLYSPVRDGPQKLLRFYSGDMTSHADAVRQLSRIEPRLAEVSMTLIPSDYALGMTPSMSSDILLGQRIPASAYARVKDAYAEKLLKYKDVIEVEYTANYIESEAIVQVCRDDAGQAFVHYLLEPSRLGLERHEGLYRTTLNVNGSVSDASGRTIHQFDRLVPIELGGEQLAGLRGRPLSFQDAFPLIEGDFTFNLLLKNTVSREFTSMEAALSIPSARALTLTPPLLANRVVRNAAFAKQVKPFTVGETQLVASPRNDFGTRDVLTLYGELGGITDELRRAGSVVITLAKDDLVVASTTKTLEDAAEPFRILEEFPLGSLPPAYYTARIAVLDDAKAVVLSSKADFAISLQPSLTRSWIVHASLPPADDPAYANTVGRQHLRAGDLAKARTLLEEAVRRAPGSAPYALDYCRALFASQDYEGVQSVAGPFYRDERKHEFAQLLGESAQALGRCGEAIGYYKDHLAHRGTDLNVLNAIGECCVRTGDLAGAAAAWERSLALDPGQEEIKRKLGEIRFNP